MGERWRQGEALFYIAHGYARRGEEARARANWEEALALCREIGVGGGASFALLSLGYFAFRRLDYVGAQGYLQESLAVSKQVEFKLLSALSLVGLGIVLVAQGQPTHATPLWGAADKLRETLGLAGVELFDLPYQREIEPAARELYERAEATARAHLGEQSFAAAWAEGWSMTAEQTLASTD